MTALMCKIVVVCYGVPTYIDSYDWSITKQRGVWASSIVWDLLFHHGLLFLSSDMKVRLD